jgi:uncharacterized SAM-dependent methyltransferase
MRKSAVLLQAFVDAGKAITYYAVDLSRDSLTACLRPLVQAFPSLRFVGLHGTYEEVLAWARTEAGLPPGTPRVAWLWLGSSIGNYHREQAAAFLARCRTQGMRPQDVFVCGIDKRNDPERVRLAYNDREGWTERFILNGLCHANALFAPAPGVPPSTPATPPLVDVEAFAYRGVYNATKGRHEAHYLVTRPLTLRHPSAGEGKGVLCTLAAGEAVHIEYSYKYDQAEVDQLLARAGMTAVARWEDGRGEYGLHLWQPGPESS